MMGVKLNFIISFENYISFYYKSLILVKRPRRENIQLWSTPLPYVCQEKQTHMVAEWIWNLTDIETGKTE